MINKSCRQEITLSDEIKALSKASKDEWALQIDAQLKKYNKDVLKFINESHLWVFKTDFVLKKEFNNVSESDPNKLKKLNQIFWADVSESIIAAQYIYIFRSDALLRSSISNLNKGDFLSAAIICRSLLEITMWHLYHANIFEHGVSKLIEKHGENGKLPINKYQFDGSEFDEVIIKLIWGTNREKEKKQSPETKQHKVVKVFKEIAKSEADPFIEELYDFLCELTHPNVVGNNLFLNFDIDINFKPTQTEFISISCEQTSDKVNSTVEKCLSGCVWSIKAIINTVPIYASAIRKMRLAFDLDFH